MKLEVEQMLEYAKVEIEEKNLDPVILTLKDNSLARTCENHYPILST